MNEHMHYAIWYSGTSTIRLYIQVFRSRSDHIQRYPVTNEKSDYISFRKRNQTILSGFPSSVLTKIFFPLLKEKSGYASKLSSLLQKDKSDHISEISCILQKEKSDHALKCPVPFWKRNHTILPTFPVPFWKINQTI